MLPYEPNEVLAAAIAAMEHTAVSITVKKAPILIERTTNTLSGLVQYRFADTIRDRVASHKCSVTSAVIVFVW